MPAYYSGRDGDPFTDAVMHESRDCLDLEAAEGSARPVADDTVALLDSVEWCGKCSSGGGGGGYLRDEPPEVQIDEGVCPWCPPDDRYEGGHVGQHASSAHPEEWANYKANE